MSGLRWWFADAVEMVRRNLLHIRRTPELLLDVTECPEKVLHALEGVRQAYHATFRL